MHKKTTFLVLYDAELRTMLIDGAVYACGYWMRVWVRLALGTNSVCVVVAAADTVIPER